MQRRWLEMHDYVTLESSDLKHNNKHLIDAKDSKSPVGNSLLIKLDATHSANPNRNKRFYRSDRMQEAVGTWTNKAIPVPVLHEHNTKGSVFGRVRSAKYIDETHLYDSDYPVLRDMVFYNTDSTRVPLFESVDWISENLVGQDGYTGLGYIELGVQVTDPEAIRKIFNEEFLSVSVGFRTDAAVCSICHTDWAAEDKCNHKLGHKYDGKDAFLITGNLDYNEVSFVNFPADPFAKITSIQQFSDSLNKRFYLGLPDNRQQELMDAVGLTMSDSVISLDDDISVYYEDSMDPKNLTLETLDTFIPEIKSKDLTDSKAFEFKAMIDSLNPESTEDKAKVRSIKSTLNSRIKREKWVNVADNSTETAALETEMETALAPAETTVTATDSTIVNPWANFSYANDDERAFFEDAEGLTEEIKLELEGYTDSITDEAAVCGPNKSFVVTDSASAAACKSVVSKAPITDATKEKIVNCIDAREIALGLKTIEAVDSLDTSVTYTDAAKGAPEKCVAGYTELHGIYSAADPTMRSKMRNMHSAVGEHWRTTSNLTHAENILVNSGHNVNAYGDAIEILEKFYTDASEEEKAKIVEGTQGTLTKWTPTITLVDSANFTVVPNTEFADKEETINELTSELTAEKAKSKAFFKESKRALATQIILSKVIAGNDGFKALTPEALEVKIVELSARNIVSLRDSVKDILTEQKFLSTTGTDSHETTARVDENTQVTEADTVVTLTDSKEPEESVEDLAVLAGALKYFTPAERARYFAEKSFSKQSA